MRKITTTLLAFGIAAGFAAAGDEGSKEGCPSCKETGAAATTLATARKAFADVPKAEEKLTADQRTELTQARDFLMQTSFGKSMGPSFEACGWLTLAASAQPGTSPEAAALLKDMGATYCTIAKAFGACAGCESCKESGECCKACSEMTPETMATKAKESLDTSKKLLAVAVAEKPTPEQMEKIQAAMGTMKELCPCMPAMQGATAALNDAFASLAKMGIPSTDAKNASRDALVKAAIELHGQMTACSSSEECEDCDEGCAEETEEAEAPAKTS